MLISENSEPIFSYKTILEEPQIQEIIKKTILQLEIEEKIKQQLIEELNQTINNFEDFKYTWDIDNYKLTLYTTLSDINKEKSLIDFLSTDEFIERINQHLKSQDIKISIEDDNREVSLEEYTTLLKKWNVKNILPIIRWLYQFNKNHTKIERDITEIAAAIKKHIILNNNDTESSQKLSSTIENKKNSEHIEREDQSHYNTLSFYTEALFNWNHLNIPQDYTHMMNSVINSIKYFENTDKYKKDKIDKLIYTFLKVLINKWLSQYQKNYINGNFDVFNIMFQEKLELDNLMHYFTNNSEYQVFILETLKNKKTELESNIKNSKEAIDLFYRPSRESRCANTPFRGAPIKSDNEYERKLNNLKLTLDMQEKNLELIQNYKTKEVA